jgi:hypothetical protein
MQTPRKFLIRLHNPNLSTTQDAQDVEVIEPNTELAASLLHQVAS